MDVGGVEFEPETVDGSTPLHTRSGRDLFVATLATTTAALPVFLVGTLAVQMRESLHFSAQALGLAITLSYLGAAVWSIPSGRIAESFGGVRVLRFASIIGSALLALLGGVTQSWWALAVLLFLSGMVSASIATSSNLFLARRTDAAHQGLIFGVKQAAIPLASLLGGLAVPTLALTVGWRWAFFVGALLALIASGLVPKPQSRLVDRRNATQGVDKPSLKSAPLVLLGIGLGLGIFAASGLAAFMVTAAVHLGISRSGAGMVAALAGGSAVIVRVGTGFLADRRGGRHFPVVAAMMVVGALGYFTVALGSATHTAWLFVLGSVIALGLGWGWNGLFNFAVIRTHRQAPARATGITQVGGRLGGMLAPVLVGVLVGDSLYTLAWLIMAFAGLGAAIAVIAGRRLLMANLK